MLQAARLTEKLLMAVTSAFARGCERSSVVVHFGVRTLKQNPPKPTVCRVESAV